MYLEHGQESECVHGPRHRHRSASFAFKRQTFVNVLKPRFV